MSAPKIATCLTICALLVASAVLIPFPWFTQSPFVIEPVNVYHVYTVTPGFLTDVRVQPGDFVAAGDPLAVLSNPELDDTVRLLADQLQVAETMAATYRKIRDAAAEVEAEEEILQLESQLSEARRQAAHLIVRAPIAGTVIEPPAVPEPTLNALKERLPGWHGTPLEPQNRDAFLDERTHVCSIAPVDGFRAILMVDQADRDDVALGREVRLKLEHMPHVKLTGVVSEISDRQRDYAPPALSNKYGGPLSTVADAEGREKLAGTVVYQVTVDVDQDPAVLKSGMRGEARFIIAQRSAAEWLWRLLRQTFHFRL